MTRDIVEVLGADIFVNILDVVSACTVHLAYFDQIRETFPATLSNLALASKRLNHMTTPYIHRKVHINFDDTSNVTVEKRVQQLLASQLALTNIRDLSFSSDWPYKNNARYPESRAKHLETAVSLIKAFVKLSNLR